MRKVLNDRSNQIVWLLFVSLLWLAAGRAEAVLLRYDLKKGDTARYKEMSAAAMRMSTSMMGQDNTMSGQQTYTVIYRETVTDVTPEGVISLVRTLESGKSTAKMSGMEEEMTEDMPKTETFIKMTNQGKILSARTSSPEDQTDGDTSDVSGVGMGSFGLDTAAMEAVFSHFPLPEEDVKPNDTWTDEVRMPGMLGGTAATVTFKSCLLAVDRFDDRDCAKIRTVFEIPLEMDPSEMMGDMLPQGTETDVMGEASGKIAGRIEWQFDYKRGCVVYAEGPVLATFDSSFSLGELEGQSLAMSTSMAMKANEKIWLIGEEEAPQ
ncbi:MAG: hypothetical protein GTO55_07765 [Armatimonadetes bacterium]|nr:hypothetical protein [Armatimonadota bacterium]NIM24160.1 hypothetical protein [Armatimonadota bacterium]NIM68019.1 hypothetical protein [Armatimonadota bacterium]NIM76514.1 hypothetical protein [Armatimonadota bacterium]NIN06253.1 hypothetical protein [Armatimonadota bacterium]